jgi:hypothetical protein
VSECDREALIMKETLAYGAVASWKKTGVSFAKT